MTDLDPARSFKKWTMRITLLAIAIFAALIWPPNIPESWWIIVRPDFTGLSKDELVTAQGQLRLFGVQAFAAIGASIALLYTARNFALARRGQVTDRFTKALERLSSSQIYVRIGGILALKQILQDAPNQAEDAAQVLQTFVHEHTEEQGEIDGTECVLPDVQVALSALGHAVHRAGTSLQLRTRKLAGADLRGFRLENADLAGSSLKGAEISLCSLIDTDMSGIDATDANMSHSRFWDCDFFEGRLHKVEMEFADFSYATFNESEITPLYAYRARFSHCVMIGAKLSGVFRECDFRHANFITADLRGMNVVDANFEGAKFERANLDGADLSKSSGLTVDQLLIADITSTTILPEGMEGDQRIQERIARVVELREEEEE
ncbi:pentapeptide repeat-containing protein [Streptomyces niger]|uniref:pentapeptide repeat-containing protein n=1 Tax=Streptomyces niger TaxID=66373 RepID=UPI0018FE1304|nr:pentapeptide repeat-containing protein [Streptomyces niger]